MYDAEDLKKVVGGVLPAVGNEDEFSSVRFNGDYMITSNARICIVQPFESDFNCSVPAKEFYNLIPSSGEVELSVSSSNMTIKSGRKKASLALKEDVIDHIFSRLNLTDVTWKNMPPDLLGGLKLCRYSASTEMIEPFLTCVLVKNKEVIASDEVRISNYALSKSIRGTWLIPARSVGELVKLDIKKYAVSDSWLYFKTADDKIFCARRLDGDYPDIRPYFDFDPVDTITIPEDATKEAVDYVSTMAEVGEDDYEQIVIKFAGKVMTFRGETEIGWAEQKVNLNRKVKRNITIIVNPDFFKELLKQSNELQVGEDRVLVESKNFKHLVALYDG